ncbi:hypothetical protein CRM94_25055 [Burkholderia gladioli]|uniref:Uncharacterized protein n=1 Tax=Burkholderia gladioli TaxID=28095 RepID=A0A2A7S2F6_BURGA|nr:hypothetical protein CEJ98_14135 [Burkholderia gladioli pv. gladioli]AWY54747.1 hypothetical protein A8H28_26995 [Burkholderia gladioli pv. gladioli]PEH37761.1 hypothetical protein CRM94_25055 [Burkholderia gladioli]
MPANIAALRAQVVQDTANLRTVARQITDTQNASSEQQYVTARLKLDQDIIQLKTAAQPILEPKQSELRQTWAQAEAAALAGDAAQAASLRAQYRQQKSNFQAYKASLVGNF